MSSKDVLFVRNSEDGAGEDAWNDDVLITLYDKALQVAKKEVAQRIAMETNNKSPKSDAVGTETIKKEFPKSHYKKNKKKATPARSSFESWMQGDNCRAVYTEDGLEYEAVIKKILDDETCIVTYIGYGNEEVQPLSGLLASKGRHELEEQRRRVAEESGANKGTGIMDDETDEVMEDNVTHEPSSVNKKYSRSSLKNLKPSLPPGFHLPNMPPLPAWHGMDSGIAPPPPTPFLFNDLDGYSEEKALYPMLVSWYMSGYYTGLYQGQKMRKQSGNKN